MRFSLRPLSLKPFSRSLLSANELLEYCELYPVSVRLPMVLT